MRQRFRQAKADVWTMRQLFPEAEQLARAGGRAQPGPDDLVLAALGLPDGTARRALESCGVTARALRAATEEVRGAPAGASAPLPDPPTGAFDAEPSMRMTFHVAVGIAKADRSHVRSGDVLLAALQSPEGIVATALARLGVSTDDVRDAVARSGPQ